MIYSLNSIRYNRPLRAVGLVAVVASLAAACGTSTVPATNADGVVAESTNVIKSTVAPAPEATTAADADANVPTTNPPSDAAGQSNNTPAPAPAPTPTTPAPAPDPAPKPNQAPVLDTVRITRQGVNVTVGINASDPDGDSLSLRLTSLGPDGTQIDHEAEADAAVFELPFSADSSGIVTIMTSVSDGTDTTIQNDSIDIAPLLHVTFGTGEISASNGCFNTDDSLTLKNANASLFIDPRGTIVSGGELVSPITLTRQNRGSQLLRTPLEADFAKTTGFAAQILVTGTIGDIPIRVDAGHVLPGRYQPQNFVSPSNAACWVTIAYVISVDPAA